MQLKVAVSGEGIAGESEKVAPSYLRARQWVYRLSVNEKGIRTNL